jgi:soluble lytic murein transglycosylase-like protein
MSTLSASDDQCAARASMTAPGSTSACGVALEPSTARMALTSRRRALAGCVGLLAHPLVSPLAHAGAQVEEPIATAVRSAMSAAVADQAPPQPTFVNIEERLKYLAWLGAMSQRMKARQRDDTSRVDFLQALWYEAKRAGLEPALVLGLIQVESGFRKYAISIAGARGYMQVMPFWVRLLGQGDVSQLFHMQTNLRFGCAILRHYLNVERGDLFLALGRYNGSRGRAEYPDSVFGARRLWDYKPAAG